MIDRFARRWLVAVVGLIFAGFAHGAAAPEMDEPPIIAKEQTTRGTTIYVPHDNFSCRETVFFAMEVSQFHGRTLTLVWTDPLGKTRETIDQTIVYGATWLVSMDLIPARSYSNFMSEPNSGYEEFVGVWTAELFLDGRVIWSKEFRIDC